MDASQDGRSVYIIGLDLPICFDPRNRPLAPDEIDQHNGSMLKPNHTPDCGYAP